MKHWPRRPILCQCQGLFNQKGDGKERGKEQGLRYTRPFKPRSCEGKDFYNILTRMSSMEEKDTNLCKDAQNKKAIKVRESCANNILRSANLIIKWITQVVQGQGWFTQEH